MGILCSTIVFSIIGVIVLSIVKSPRLSVLTLFSFVVSSEIAAFAFMILYGRLFAMPSGELTSRPAVIGLLLGTPIFATLVGWTAAFAISTLRRKSGVKEDYPS